MYRKRRTREHVIADQSFNHIERFIIDAGHTAQRWGHDYGYDLVMTTFDEQGYVETGVVFWQLKASEQLPITKQGIAFDLDIRDYNLWRVESFPVILALFDASVRKAYWLHVQQYFDGTPSRVPRKGAKTIRVYAPPRQIVNLRAIETVRTRKTQLRSTIKRFQANV